MPTRKPSGFPMPFSSIITQDFDSPSSLQPSLSHQDVAWMSEWVFADDLPSTPCLQDLIENEFYGPALQREGSAGSNVKYGASECMVQSDLLMTYTQLDVRPPQEEQPAKTSSPPPEASPRYSPAPSCSSSMVCPSPTSPLQGMTYGETPTRSYRERAQSFSDSPQSFHDSPQSCHDSPRSFGDVDVDEGSNSSASTLYPCKLLPLPVVEVDPPSLLVMRDAYSPATELHSMPLVDFPTFTGRDFERALRGGSGSVNEEDSGTNVKAKLNKKIRGKRKSQGLEEEPEASEPKSNKLSADDIERYERRKLSNRKAATKQRQKKKEESARLQKEMAEYETTNEELRAEITTLKSEVSQLSDTITQHKRVCPSWDLDPQHRA